MLIYWLHGPNEMSATTKALWLATLRAQGINSTDIIFNSLHRKVPNLGEYPKNKQPASYICRAAQQQLAQDISVLHPKVIVIQDEGTLRALTESNYTLSKVRGSIYDFRGTPCLVLDQNKNVYSMKEGRFIFGLDMAKLVRYATGKVKNEPAFNWKLCETIDDVEQLVARGKEAKTWLAVDTETKSGFITVVSYTFDCNGLLQTFTVPLFDPDQPNGCYWKTPEVLWKVHTLLKEIQSCSVLKCMQNGMYDCAYFINEHIPPENYLLDTQHMMHSIWVEAPKSLDYISSYFLDSYQYWKDEKKGMEEENYGRAREDVIKYWRYNGLDTHYTWLCCKELLSRIVQLPWAMRNYNSEFSLAVGPCLAASLRGILIDKDRHAQIMAKKAKEVAEGKKSLIRLTHQEDFNPNSTEDVAWFVYDICGAEKTRVQRKGSKWGPRSCDKRVLKLMKEQNNPILNNFIKRLLACKTPAADISKYGDLFRMCTNAEKGKRRFASWLNPGGTETGRMNSGSNQFWRGTNGQNIPAPMREFFVADHDWVILDIDYSSSDDRFIAYETEDPVKMELVESNKDGHCFHCATFFSRGYDEIVRGWKADDPKIVDEPTGIRQITKKIVHGRNYREGPATMYNLMGRDAVVATAIALGHVRAAAYGDKELIGICQQLCDKYDHPHRGLYRRIRPWQDEIIELAVRNDNLVTCAGGMTRKFFGDLRNDHAAQREVSAYYGQGGTAGNINRAVRKIWYSGLDDGRHVQFLLQVHDSLIFAIHKTALHKVEQIKRIMEEPTIIHGRSVVIPAAPKVGLTWAKKMLNWTPETTYADVLRFEEKVFAEKYPKNALPELAGDMSAGLDEFFNSIGEIEVVVFDDEDETDETELLGFEQAGMGAPNGDRLELAN